MQIKRFEAKNMSEALRLIKKELGPDAVLLSARSLKKQGGLLGGFRKMGVEVTAAIDNPAQSNPLSESAAVSRTRKRRSGFDDANRPYEKYRRNSALRSYRQYSRRRTDSIELTDKKGTGSEQDLRVADHNLYRHLISQNISEALAVQIVSEVEARLQPEQSRDHAALVTHFVKAIQKIGVRAEPINIKPDMQQVAVFAGLSGVGKTSAVVKIASQLTMATEARIAIISLDNQRIAGTEPLRKVSRILQIPFTLAVTPRQFAAALKSFQNADLVLVDTPALIPGDPEQIKRIRKILSGCKNIQTHLVCSATTAAGHLSKIQQRFNGLGFDRMIITKLDEAGFCGCLIEFPVQLQLPIAAVSSGHAKPESLTEANPDMLARHVLYELTGGESDREPSLVTAPIQPETDAREAGKQSEQNKSPASHSRNEAYFVANRNSDVFHIPDCRWTKMIKDENIIVFASIPEAESKQFKPCRSCCPPRASNRAQSAFDGMRQQMTGSG